MSASILIVNQMAFDVLTDTYRQLRSRLTAMAAAMLGNRDEADDALQEAFCKLWRHHGEIKDSERARALLTTAVRNTGIDVLRHRRPTVQPDDAALAGDDLQPDDTGEMLDVVTQLIDKYLTPRQRMILYQRDRDGWDFDEIAQYHNLTESNVRVIVSRARCTIREVYRQTHIPK